MAKQRSSIQFAWGIALVLAGIGVFFRVPQVMPRIEQIEQFSSVTIYIRFCFYLMGIVLISGGSKKVFDHFPKA